MENPSTIVGQYQLVLQVEMRPNTARLYETAVLRFRDHCTTRSAELYLPEGWGWADVGVQAVERYLQQGRQELGWRENTAHAHLTAIRHFFRFLTRNEHLDRNPIQHYTRRKSSGTADSSIVQAEELAAKLQQLPTTTHEQLTAVLLLELTYGTGVSVAQLCRVANLESLPQSGSLRIHFSERSPLERPLGAHALALLQRYLKVQRSAISDQLSVATEPPPRNRPPTTEFWMDEAGKPLPAVALKKLLQAPLQELGFPSANALRDAGLQHLAAAGADMRTLQNYRGLKRLQRVQDFKSPAFAELQDRLLTAHPRKETPETTGAAPE